MILVVGLGNPGKKFQNTRHNLGFRVVDELVRKFNFPKFKLSKEFWAEISEGEIANKKVILVKPQTFMNLSGKSVRSLIRNLKLEIRNLIVIHDDLDIPLGKIRIVKNRGSAGHKGVESIIKELGTKNFVRFRIGIRPNSKFKNQKSKLQFRNQKLDEFVLKEFSRDEKKIVKEVVKRTAQAIEMTLKESLEKAMCKFNK